jgi:hypothetical protein
MASMHGNAIWLEGYIHGRLLEEAEKSTSQSCKGTNHGRQPGGHAESNKKVQLERGSAQNAQWEIKQIRQ